MKKNRKPVDFLNEPHYKGGQKAIDEFVRKRLEYPKEAIDNKIEGDVEIRYDINHKGKVIKTEIVKGIGHGCDQEAQRIVGLLRFDVHVPRGIRATFHRNIKIHFRLPKAKLNYSYTSKAALKEKAEKRAKSDSNSTVYSYTLNIRKKG